MKCLQVEAIETPIFKLGDSLANFIQTSLEKAGVDPKRLEGKILIITSKIVSLSEKRIVPKSEISKEALVKRESDHYMGEIAYGCFLTIKNGLFIPSAGIDESNAEGDFYILYPADPYQAALEIRNTLAGFWNLKNLGVILSDSKVTPLRGGVTGVSLAHAGFRGVNSHVGQPDLFGTPLKMTTVNVADALAAAAVVCMGEANESCPLALVTADVHFQTSDAKTSEKEVSIPMDFDLYGPMFKRLGLES